MLSRLFLVAVIATFANSSETGSSESDSALETDFESYTNKYLGFYTDSTGKSYTIGNKDHYFDTSDNLIDFWTDENGSTQTINHDLLDYISQSYIGTKTNDYLIVLTDHAGRSYTIGDQDFYTDASGNYIDYWTDENGSTQTISDDLLGFVSQTYIASKSNSFVDFYTDSAGRSYTIGDNDHYMDASGIYKIDFWTDENGSTKTINDDLLYYLGFSYIGDDVESYETDAASSKGKTGAKESSASVGAAGTGSNSVATSTSGTTTSTKGSGSGSTTSTKGSDSGSTTSKKGSNSGSTTNKPSKSDSTSATGQSSSGSSSGKGNGANLYVPVAGLFVALAGAII
ncbi:hypothetical protein CLIB1423_33S00452 [[Candida] railenensis]|uniref:Cell wall protein n=1 Tax=[Candida] railenensis TaxID=45579 RepID=A0A9P0W172_9ASCO|nr:hypothetical protein CLIB1423_33S00452 [[Candida] railenensis]